MENQVKKHGDDDSEESDESEIDEDAIQLHRMHKV